METENQQLKLLLITERLAKILMPNNQVKIYCADSHFFTICTRRIIKLITHNDAAHFQFLSINLKQN
jgi:hypothetical protein